MDNKKDNFYIDDVGIPRSAIYNDLYFSKDNGYEESLYNFPQGIDLIDMIAIGDRDIKIAELGFGTGLNFLITAGIFNKHRKQDQHLHYFGLEAHPLSIDQITKALAPFYNKIKISFDDLKHVYPAQIPAIHHIYVGDHITLTLGFGFAENIMLKMQDSFDGWYLDGFNPRDNPNMWNSDICEHIARLSHHETRLATFTAAGFVKRNLQAVGFDMSKTDGYGHKRERLIGIYNDQTKPRKQKRSKKVAIIGAGIAGCSAVAVAKRYGHEVTLFERAAYIGAGASGNLLGLLNPKLEAQPSRKTEFYSSALSFAHHFYSDLQDQDDIGYSQCGSIHVMTDERKEKRFQKFINNLGWGDNLVSLDEQETTEKLGFTVKDQRSLFMPLSARLSPLKTIEFLSSLADDVCLNTEIVKIQTTDSGEELWSGNATSKKSEGVFDVVIIANGFSAKELCPELDTEMSVIRGQITHIKNTVLSKTIKHHFSGNLCFGGYISHRKDDEFILGATYDRDVAQEDDIQQRNKDDDVRNVEYMKRMIGDGQGISEIIDGRASLRVTTKDYMPLIKQYNDRKIYLSLAHRSHGLLSAPLSAHLLFKEIID